MAISKNMQIINHNTRVTSYHSNCKRAINIILYLKLWALHKNTLEREAIHNCSYSSLILVCNLPMRVMATSGDEPIIRIATISLITHVPHKHTLDIQKCRVNAFLFEL